MPDREIRRKSTSDRDRDRAALRDLAPGIVALVVLHGIASAVDLDVDAHPWHLAVALLPFLPGLWLVRAQLRGLRRSDELQRMAQLEAMAVGFGVAVVVAYGGGLLDSASVGSTAQYLQLTFIAGILAWVAALAHRLRERS